MKAVVFTVVSVALGFVTFRACAEFRKAAEPRNVPELLRTTAGDKVETVRDWELVRRQEIKSILCENVYGVRPVERPADLSFSETTRQQPCYGGRAIRKRVRATYSGPGGRQAFNLSAWIPAACHPSAVFVYCSPQLAEYADLTNGPMASYWLPVEEIVRRGYSAIAFCSEEIPIDWDKADCASNGVFKAFGPEDLTKRQPTEWGIVSAWAWGVSRIVDWIETEPSLDSRRIAVVGFSRYGKAALVAGAFDERIAMTISCCSGCAGAKLNHIDLWTSERIKNIIGAEKWFCPAFRQYVGKESSMPFDQHFLLALVAPRLLYVSSATEDPWAGPRGEFWSAAYASGAWELYGMPAFVQHGFPNANVPLLGGSIGYHIREGVHDITRYDWRCYMDFADRHGWNIKQGRGRK